MTCKPDPNRFAAEAMHQDWNKMFAFAFSPFSLIGRVINKVLRENVEAINTSDTNMTNKIVVYSPTKNVHTTFIAFISSTKPITNSPERKTFPSGNQVPKVSGVENYSKTLEIE